MQKCAETFSCFFFYRRMLPSDFDSLFPFLIGNYQINWLFPLLIIIIELFSKRKMNLASKFSKLEQYTAPPVCSHQTKYIQQEFTIIHLQTHHETGNLIQLYSQSYNSSWLFN